MKQETVDAVKQIGDAASVITVIGTLAELLPAVAALFTIVWTSMRMAEMITGKEFSVLIGFKKETKNAEQQ
jgi:hypothetical protein